MFGHSVDVEIDCNGLSIFFLLGVVVEYPLLISSHNPMQKIFSLLSLNQLFANEKSPFNVFRFQFIRYPISLFLNHSHALNQNVIQKWLVELPPMIPQAPFAFDSDLLQVMPLILCLRIFLSRARLVFNAEISILETSKSFSTWFISWSSITINFDKHSMGFSRTFLPIKVENQILPQMLLG